MNRSPRPTPLRGRTAAPRALALVLATVLSVAACGTTTRTSQDQETRASSPAPSATVTAPAEATAQALPEIPVRSADVPPVVHTPAPVSLTLTTLGLTVPIDPVGVQADGQMEIPPRADRAGWYRFGASPGAPEGTAVIAAHVDSVASDGLGPFAQLKDLEPGATVEVTLDDGTVHQFAVTEVGAQPKTGIPWGDVFVRDGAPRLILITCGGTWDTGARSYSDNVIVTTGPVGG